MSTDKYKVGDRVIFGRPNGEQTKGEVVKVNVKNLKVKQIGWRGSGRRRPDGTVWTVPPSLVRHDLLSHQEVEPPVLTTLPGTQGDRMGFDVGDMVRFQGRGRVIIGRVRRINMRTLSIQPKGERAHWRVPPALVCRV